MVDMAQSTIQLPGLACSDLQNLHTPARRGLLSMSTQIPPHVLLQVRSIEQVVSEGDIVQVLVADRDVQFGPDTFRCLNC